MKLGGYNLKENKRILDSIQKIFGIGDNKARQIIELLHLTESTCFKDLDYADKFRLHKIIIHYIHGFQAIRDVKNHIDFLKQNRSYRGVRHDYCLSVRGQNTRTNGKTQKNKKNKRKNKTGRVIEKKTK